MPLLYSMNKCDRKWSAPVREEITCPHWSLDFLEVRCWALDENLLWQSQLRALLPCSNFQSSAMFEGSESAEVEGGSTESTVASSISACKKVKTKLCVVCLCVCVKMEGNTLHCVSLRLSIYCSRACTPVHHICLVCQFISVFPAVQEIFISSSRVPVTPRGCVIRGTARPSDQPNRFIISQCQRDRRGNSTDQWAEVKARLNFLSKCVWVYLCVCLTVCVYEDVQEDSLGCVPN